MTVILYLYFIYFIRGGGCIGVLFYFEVLIKN